MRTRTPLQWMIGAGIPAVSRHRRTAIRLQLKMMLALFGQIFFNLGSFFVEGTPDQTCTCIVRPQPLQDLKD